MRQRAARLGMPAMRVERVVAAACAALVVVWAVGYLAWPFSNDQGILSWVGEVVRRGGMPYRDGWDVKGPLTYLLYAVPGALFGRNQWGLRAFDLAVLGVGLWCVARIVRQQGGSAWAGRVASLLWLLWYASIDHHGTAQPDGWAAVLLAGAVVPLTRRGVTSGFTRSTIAAGALIGAAMLVKPTYAAMLAMPALQGVASFRAADARRAVMQGWLAVAMGAALVVGACWGWLAANGALDAMLDVQFGWIPTAYTDVTSAWPSRIYTLMHHLTAEHFALAMPFVVAGLALAWRRARADAALFVAWVGASLLGVAAQGNFWEYHWHALYPPMAVLAALTLDAIVAPTEQGASAPPSHAPGAALRTFASSAAIMLLVSAALEPAMDVYRRALRPGTWHSLFGPYASGEAFDETVRWIRERSDATEPVLVWGQLSGVNWLADRASVSRFAHMTPLVVPPGNARRERYRDELLDGVRRTPPRLVIALASEMCARRPTEDERFRSGEVPRVLFCLEELPALHDIVRRDYDVDRRIGLLEIWRRRDAR